MQQLRTEGRFAIATDGIQWIVQRRSPAGHWHSLSFIRSTRSVLARCLREAGCQPPTVGNLIAGLPDSFDAWNAPTQL